MFLPETEHQINNEIKAFKELKQKLPFSDSVYEKEQKPLSHPKPRGIPPAYISEFYIKRLTEDPADVLGGIVGYLDAEIQLTSKKDCYLLPSSKPSLPSNTDGQIFIWAPPITTFKATNESPSDNLEFAFFDLVERLKDYYLILPKSFLANKNVKRLRKIFFSKTSNAMILKYSAFNALLLRISINENHPKIRPPIPCKIFTGTNRKSYPMRVGYKMYFRDLADELEKNNFKNAKWELSTDKQKSLVLPVNFTKETLIGDYIEIAKFFDYPDEKLIQPGDIEKFEHLGVYFSHTFREEISRFSLFEEKHNSPNLAETNDPDYDSSNDQIMTSSKLKFNLIPLSSNVIILKARTPFKVLQPPIGAKAILLQNNFYVIKLKNGLDNLPDGKIYIEIILQSINKFLINNNDELKVLIALGFEMIRQIPFVKNTGNSE